MPVVSHEQAVDALASKANISPTINKLTTVTTIVVNADIYPSRLLRVALFLELVMIKSL